MVEPGVLDIELEEELFKLQEEIIKIKLLTSWGWLSFVANNLIFAPRFLNV